MPSGDIVSDDQVDVASITPTKKSSFFKRSSKSGTVVSDEDVDLESLKGSVFDTGVTKVARGKEAAISAAGGRGVGGSIAQVGLGAGLAGAANVASTIVAPEWTAAKIGAQAVAGFISPDAQHLLSKITGQPDAAPTWSDRIRSAAIGMGISSVTEGVAGLAGVKGGTKVASQFEGANSNVVNAQQIKAGLLRQDMLEKQGIPKETIDAWFQRVEKDPNALNEMTGVAQVAHDTHQQYQEIYNTFKQDFNGKFAAIPHQNATVPTTPISSSVNDILQKAPVQARDSSVFKFLQEKQAELGGGAGGPITVGGKPVTDPALIARIQAGQPTPTITLGELRQRITESYENEPRNASQAEKSMMVQYREKLREQFDTGMHAAGATNEDLANVKKLYSSYGDYAEALRSLDPRDERMGTKAADMLFGQAYKQPDEGVLFAKYVQQAAKLNPAIMNQFKQGIVQHFLNSAQEKAAGTGVMAETRALGDIQRDIYNASGTTTKSGATFLKIVFGDGPLANPANLAKVMRNLTNPDIAARDIGAISQAVNFLRPNGATNYLMKYALLTGFGGLVLGQQVGISKLIQHPAALGVALGGFLLTGAAARTFLGSDNVIAQKYGQAILTGKTEHWADFIRATGNLTGGALNGAINLNAQAGQQEAPSVQP